MGCGASKSAAGQVVPSTTELPPITSSDAAKTTEVKKNKPEQSLKAAPLTKPVIPSIPSASEKKAIAFEIPLDELVAKPSTAGSTTKLASSTAPSKLSLPKLHLSEKDIQEKLANSEERWKVGAYLDRLLDGDLDQQSKQKRRKGERPQLTSSKRVEDQALLKQRLLEKEAAAAQNRQRELERIQAKLANKEAQLRRVQERKKQLEDGGAETDENQTRLSWGGEDGGLAKAAGKSGSKQVSFSDSSEQDDYSSRSVSSGKLSRNSASDSGSYTSSSSRGGSGRSTNTDTTSVEDPVTPPIGKSVLPNIKVQAQAGVRGVNAQTRIA